MITRITITISSELNHYKLIVHNSLLFQLVMSSTVIQWAVGDQHAWSFCVVRVSESSRILLYWTRINLSVVCKAVVNLDEVAFLVHNE